MPGTDEIMKTKSPALHSKQRGFLFSTRKTASENNVLDRKADRYDIWLALGLDEC